MASINRFHDYDATGITSMIDLNSRAGRRGSFPWMTLLGGLMMNDTNADWIARAHESIIQSRYTADVVLVRGTGCEVEDVEGRSYLDFESGQVCMSLGHGHPEVHKAMLDQMSDFMQSGTNFFTTGEIELAEALRERSPLEDSRAYTASTGSEANEAAMRLAKRATGRFEVVGVQGAYHGQTHGSWSLTTHIPGALNGYGPLMGGVAHVPTPYCFRCPLGLKYPSCDIACADMAEEVIDRQTSGHPAAFIYEVVMSAGGIIVPPREWFDRIRQMCTDRGILMIADEAQTAMGRTGSWFACEQTGTLPDIVTLSKSLGGGVPLSAVVATGTVATAGVAAGYSQSSSHCGDPFTTAVGLANIRVLERDGLLARAHEIGDVIKGRMTAVQERSGLIGDVRGMGSICGIEIVEPGTNNPAPRKAAEIFDRARELGVLISMRPTEKDQRNVIRLIPPLVISDRELHEGLDVVEKCVLEADA